MPSVSNDEVIEELRAIRVRLDQLAAHFFQKQVQADLLPLWDCGHRHATRAAATQCKARQALEGQKILDGKTSDNLRVPANAEAGRFD